MLVDGVKPQIMSYIRWITGQLDVTLFFFIFMHTITEFCEIAIISAEFFQSASGMH